MMYTLWKALVLGALPIFGNCVAVEERHPGSAPVVTVKNGTYLGRHSAAFGQDFFLGVPFAQPPTGQLRLAAPQSLNSTFKGVRNATAYGPECIGYGFDQWILGNYISEDCLTLNVVRPEGNFEGHHLPVAVWIHGGTFKVGGGFDPRYNLSFIVEQSVKQGTPMIAVSIQYRLSNWGWMFSKELSAAGAGNLGIRDQRLALRWVQENIGAFGGDSRKVTVWGESAGAFSIGYQLMAYGGRDDGLFRQAILESGSSAAVKLTNASQWQPYFDAVVKQVGCSNTTSVLGCLRGLPWQTLNNVFNSTSFPVGIPGIGAHIDGDVISTQGYTPLNQGNFVKIPVLMGINTDEGASFATQGINTTQQFVNFVMGTGVNSSVANVTASLYPDVPELGLPATLKGRPEAYPWGLQWKRMVAFYGDVLFHSGRRLMADAYARAGLPVYSYRFNVFVNGNLAQQGVNHFKEVGFVFHNTHGDGYGFPGGLANPFGGKGPEYYKMSDIMSGMWVAFITSGDPNNYKLDSPCLKWPLYKLSDPQNIVFDVNVTHLVYTERDDYRKQEIAYINSQWHT